MQLTLLTTFAQPSLATSPAPPRGSAAPSREAVAMSQLDRIAAQNLRAPAHGLGGTAMLLALLGGLVVLGSASMWRGTAGNEARVAREPHKPVQVETQPAPAAAATVAPAAAIQASEPDAPTVLAAQVSTPNVVATPEPAAAAMEAAQPAADDAVRVARARQLADARRKAAQLAQERALADEAQRLQLAQQQQQQRDAERAQQQIAEQARQRAAVEQARAQTLQLAFDTRRSVGEACASAGSVFSRQFCRTRECAKAEHQGDPICLRLREDELAQQRASSDR